MSWKRPNIGSRVNREVHARFWERAEVKFLRATRQSRRSNTSDEPAGCLLQLQSRPNFGAAANRRGVPEPAVSNRSRAASLFDHLVGAQQKRFRDFEPEGLRGCQLRVPATSCAGGRGGKRGR